MPTRQKIGKIPSRARRRCVIERPTQSATAPEIQTGISRRKPGRVIVSSQDHSMQKRWEAAHEMPRFRPAYPHEQVVRWAFRNLDRNANPKVKVLDLGCGAGRHAIFFAEEGFDAYGCDISAVGLRELQLSAQQRGVTVQTHQTPGHDLSHYGDSTFDAILCFGVIYYMALAEAEQLIREVFRVLRPNGTLCFVVRNLGDSRLLHASPIGRSTWHLNAIASGAPSNMEEDMNMLFFSKEDIEQMFSSFTNLCIDRMTYVHEGFADDDWVVTASKP